MEGPSSLWAMCASAEKQTLDQFGTEEKPAKKYSWRILKTTENKLVVIHSSPSEDA